LSQPLAVAGVTHTIPDQRHLASTYPQPTQGMETSKKETGLSFLTVKEQPSNPSFDTKYLQDKQN